MAAVKSARAMRDGVELIEPFGSRLGLQMSCQAGNLAIYCPAKLHLGRQILRIQQGSGSLLARACRQLLQDFLDLVVQLQSGCVDQADGPGEALTGAGQRRGSRSLRLGRSGRITVCPIGDSRTSEVMPQHQDVVFQVFDQTDLAFPG